MRDPNRLMDFYKEIEKEHRENLPDWRFSQMMLNFFTWHMKRYANDGFYLEEKIFLKHFKEFVDEMKLGCY